MGTRCDPGLFAMMQTCTSTIDDVMDVTYSITVQMCLLELLPFLFDHADKVGSRMAVLLNQSHPKIV